MQIKGLQKLTLIDYPDKVAATIFVSGCNFKCSYCHNPELVINSKEKKIREYKEKEILEFLKERIGFLDGVCITGGEPTLNKDLPEFIKKIRKMKYNVKLDTNGTNPKMLKELYDKKLVDYIAMDIKAPLEKYKEITKSEVDINNIKKSIEIVKKFKNHEFRTTIIPNLLNKEDITKIAYLIKGANAFYLQQFKPLNCLDKNFDKKKPYPKEEIEKIRDSIKKLFDVCEIRN